MTTTHYWILGACAAIILLPFLWYGLLKMLYRPFERADETHEVTTEDGWRIALFRYLPRTDGPRYPVLLCHGAFANHHNFDIPAGGSLADYLADAGYDVWLMDFRGDRSARAPEGRSRINATADEYLLEDIPAAVDYVLEQTGCASLHGVGHSMGGMFLTAYGLEFEGYGLASLTTIGTPVSFDGLRHHPHPYLIGMMGAMAGIAGPLQRMLCSAVIFLKLRSRAYPMNFANQPDGAGAREGFHKADLLPAPVANALDTWAARGEWLMADGELDVLVEMSSMTVPWQLICARRDALTPYDAVETLMAKRATRPGRAVFFSMEDGHAIDYDHIDLVIGKHAPEEVFPVITEWFAMHEVSGAPTVAVREMPVDDDDEDDEPTETLSDDEAITVAAAEAVDIDDVSDEETSVAPRSRRTAKKLSAAAKGDGDDFEVLQRRRHGRVMDKIRSAWQEVSDGDDDPAELPGTSLDELDRTLNARISKVKAKAKSKAKPKAKAKTKAKPKAKAKAKPAAKKPAAAKKAAAKKKTSAKAKPKTTAKKKAAAKAKPAAKKKGGK